MTSADELGITDHRVRVTAKNRRTLEVDA